MKFWRPLLPEGLQALVSVFGKIEKEGCVALGVEAVGQRHVDAAIDDGLRHHDRNRSVLAVLLGDLPGLIERLALFGYMADDPIALGLRRRDPPTGPHQLLRERLSNQTR